MITFLVSIALLVIGYFVYGRYMEKVFGVDKNRPTPAIEKQDGVDFVPMHPAKIFLIQFLNIAGLGPIFGAIAGALWGPIAFLWIVFGCIFAGAVHDFLSGMLSVRHGGESLSEIVGIYLGKAIKIFMRVFSVVLLILVGVVFVKGPATILHDLTNMEVPVLIAIIFCYYILATLVPVDKLIGKVYPLFGLCLLIMAVGIAWNLITEDYAIPELSREMFQNLHIQKKPIFPMLFITIACGAISGFHATQSPMMARCMTNEKLGRRIFYGTMITEGIVALIWAAAAMSFFGGIKELGEQMSQPNHNAAWVVKEVCNSMLGKVGGILAILGVVAAPITSGDTAFRSARLTVADALGYSQKSIGKRLAITIPIFAIGFLLTQINFAIIWRYFGWANQTLATITLWAATVYLMQEGRNYWTAFIPAFFMTNVVTTYIFVAKEGVGLPMNLSTILGAIGSIVCIILFILYRRKYNRDKLNS
ncbi:carbon starvation protein A [Halosquirtibacter xylanolyticus]|uniref:carbon starvation CstA family protein n=1 Tax=Halosquirtibacter xylanolyticus TaxID=3374599 RepID=UPI0037484E39|nr:carbon starvation protein A [Prolixibacteraceae bacterium]